VFTGVHWYSLSMYPVSLPTPPYPVSLPTPPSAAVPVIPLQAEQEWWHGV
jgi:hypothetical protein